MLQDQKTARDAVINLVLCGRDNFVGKPTS